MMESPRNYDIQAAERLFKKVVHPGLNTMRIVDRNGLPLQSPMSQIRPRSFVLSPRGVPTKVPDHTYSGRSANRYTDISTSDTPELISPERFGRQSASPDSKPISRQFSSSQMSKKRAVSTTPVFNRPVPMTKSASTQRRYLSGVPSEKRSLTDNRSRWNTSSQGYRLENEWDNLSKCRALKRSSEIVGHRVDRMYFMSGNSITLQPKYHVNDDELSRLKEITKTRQTTRPARKKYNHQPHPGHVSFSGYYAPEDEQEDRDLTNLSVPDKAEDHTMYYTLAEDYNGDAIMNEGEERSNKERELIPSPLSSCMMCDQDHGKQIPTSVSDESGIHEDEDFADELDKIDADDEVTNHVEERSRPVSKVEIRHSRHDQSSSVDIFDILSHGDRKKLSDCMLKLLQNYPPHKLAESRGSMQELAHKVLVSGLDDIKRKRRANKGSYSLKNNLIHTEFKLPMSPEFMIMSKPKMLKKDMSEVKSKVFEECLVKKFPVRRPSTKFLHLQCQHPVKCDCRRSLHKGPSLTVSGRQAPIFIKA